MTPHKRLGMLLIGALALGLAVSACENQVDSGDMVIEGFNHPESVAKDPDADVYYVSNIGEELAPSEKDGDGYVSQVSADGEIQALRFLPQEGADTLHAPKGMAIVDGVLYTADVDRVVGFDLETREQVFELDFADEGTSFLNDVAAFDDEALFVSATDIGTVFRVAIGDEPDYSSVAEDIEDVNGVRYDEDETLYIVSFGGEEGIWRLPLDDEGEAQQEPELLQDGIGQLDGLAVLEDDRLLISDWQGDDEGGALHGYDLERGALHTVDLGRTIEGPADFHYNADTDSLWIPALPENRVIVTPLPQEGAEDE